MSAPNSPEREDINTFSEEAMAELVLDDTSQGEVDKPIPIENGQELTSLEVPKLCASK